MKSITVEPELLESCAVRMDERNQDYLRKVSELMTSVETMSSAWQGKDNAAFTGRIFSFEPAFRQLSVLCSNYSEFLKNSARAYRDTQDELTSLAGRLAE